MTDPEAPALSPDNPATPPPATPAGPPPGLAMAWRAPLLAYAVTLGVALVIGVLLIVALASGETLGEDDELTKAADGALAWLAIPFQLTAMALGGRLSVGVDDFSVSFMAFPLVLTATYVVVLARFAAGSESAQPSRTRQDRALTAGAAAIGAAVVVAVLTRLLALRSEGTAMHALSFSLVLGTLVLTFAGDFVGRDVRSVGVPARVRAWSPPAIAWLSSVGLWLVLSFPVLFVVTWVQEGFRAALSVPAWWPTGGLWTYAMGHLSGVGTSGYYAYAWTDGHVLAMLGLLLGAVVTTAFAAVVWHLRAGRDAASLALPASWVPLPLAFAIGGVLVTIVTIVSVGGSGFGFGGSLSIMPAAWTCLLLALWGLGAEALSRTVAPQLSAALPASLVARLRGPASEGRPEAAAPVPVTPEQARRNRRIALLVGGGLGVVVVGALAITVIGSMFFTPEKAAQRYVDALADGNVAAVAELAPGDGSTALLTDEVYEAAGDHPTDYSIDDVSVLGDNATATVTAEGGVGGEAYLSLEKAGKKFGIFQEWEVAEGLTSTLSVWPDTNEIAVNGVTVPVDGASDFTVLPGTYAVDLYPGNQWLDGATSEVSVPLGEYASPEFDSPGPSDAFTEQVDTAVTDLLDECLASTEAEPDGCPQSVYTYGDVRNLTWELTESPAVDYDFFDPTFPMSLSTSGGTATATYEVDESYGFGAPEWVEETEESSLYFNVEVDTDGDALDVSVEPW